MFIVYIYYVDSKKIRFSILLFLIFQRLSQINQKEKDKTFIAKTLY